MRAVFLTTVMSLCAVAYGQAATGIGNGGGSSFEIGARAAGMAGAYITGGDDASIVFYNPATLGVWDSLRLTGGYGYLSGDGFAGFGALVLGDTLPKIGGTIGIGYHVVSLNNITLRGYRNKSVYDSSSRQAVISYGRHLSEINERLSVGATVRYARIRGLQGKDHATELDLGLRYGDTTWILAAVGRNLTGSKLDLGGDGHPLRASAVFGGAYTSGLLDPGVKIKLRGAVDYEALIDTADRVHIGAEMLWLAGDKLTLAIRTGYVAGESQRGRPSVGMGVRWNLLDLGLELDYAYFRNEDAPHVDKWGHTVSVSVRPGRVVSWFTRNPPPSPIVTVQPPKVDTAQIVRDSLDARFDEVCFRMATSFVAGDLDSAIVAAYQLIPLASTPEKTQIALYALELVRAERDMGLGIEPTEQPVAIDDKPIPPQAPTKELSDLLGWVWILEQGIVRDLLDRVDSLEWAAELASYNQYVESARACIDTKKYSAAQWNITRALAYRPGDSVATDVRAAAEAYGCLTFMQAGQSAVGRGELVTALNWYLKACETCALDDAPSDAIQEKADIESRLRRFEQFASDNGFKLDDTTSLNELFIAIKDGSLKERDDRKSLFKEWWRALKSFF